jgi:hypothetical protein
VDLAIIPDNKKGKNVDEYRPSFRRRSPYPPTTQVKESNFQRNGSVQASLEEQFIKAGQDVYFWRKQNSFTKTQKTLEELEKAWKEFNALNEQVKQAELQLSSDALRIKQLVYQYIDLNSPPPPVMKDRFN